MLATRATCVALWLCLAVAPLIARAAAPSASQAATFVEKQGHMLLLNGAPACCAARALRPRKADLAQSASH
jgi:hypothetical protein